MKYLLFAADDIGLAIAKFIFKDGRLPICVVLDDTNRGSVNEQIVSLCTNTSVELVYNSELAKSETIAHLKNLNAELGILAWWPNIITEELIALTQKGFLNCHPSYLPYNRGRDTYFWALKNDTPYGVSIHFVTPNIDDGPICFQKKIEIQWQDTGKVVYERAKQAIVQLFKDSFDDIYNLNLEPHEQDEAKASTHYRSQLDKASEIKLDKLYSGKDLLNLLRARTYPPYAGCWFVDEGEKFSVSIAIKKEGVDE